jgi:hypothetical protein
MVLVYAPRTPAGSTISSLALIAAYAACSPAFIGGHDSAGCSVTPYPASLIATSRLAPCVMARK